MSEQFYVIPEGKVAHELMEGEVIVIHFASGCYYSLQGIAAAIWGWISEGASARQIVGAFADLRLEEEADLHAFLEQMAKEGIVEKVDRPEAGSVSAAKVHYQKPVLEIYKDMQDLMLIDPIHEVGAAGWPKPLGE